MSDALGCAALQRDSVIGFCLERWLLFCDLQPAAKDPAVLEHAGIGHVEVMTFGRYRKYGFEDDAGTTIVSGPGTFET